MTETTAHQPLFEPSFVRALEALTLAGRRVPAGASAGQWRSRTSGSSVEFADYRNYAPGDEFRRIDWNAYARLERLFVRLYRAEEDLALTLVIDASASMAWGKPTTKARVAAQLAGALAFVALQSGDRVELATCQDVQVAERLTGLRGQAAAFSAWRLLEGLQCAGATNLNAGLGACARSMRGAGMTVIISDLFSPGGYQQGIHALLGRRQDILLIHVLSPDEIDPPGDIVGDWRLVDSEPVAAV